MPVRTPGSTPPPGSPATCCSGPGRRGRGPRASCSPAVDAVVPDSVGSTAAPGHPGRPAGHQDRPSRCSPPTCRTAWPTIRTISPRRRSPSRYAMRALAVFAGLAEAEAEVHGIPTDEVHFHEVGALDSIADVVGVCRRPRGLGVTTVTCRLGRGRLRPGPRRARRSAGAGSGGRRLSRGWRVHAGGTGELTTPTGMALVAALAARCEDLPPMIVTALGAGAGTKDFPGRPNMTRVLLGHPCDGRPGAPGRAADGPGGQRRRPRSAAVAGRARRAARRGRSGRLAGPDRDEEGPAAHVLTALCRPGSHPLCRS